jgi:hypothetical protein
MVYDKIETPWGGGNIHLKLSERFTAKKAKQYLLQSLFVALCVFVN